MMLPKARVVVVAASMEGIDALARLISQLPSTFALPVVAHVQRLQGPDIAKLKNHEWRFASRPDVVHARDGDHVVPGRVYVIPEGKSMTFSAVDRLSVNSEATSSSADELFASAADWYEAGAIGVVLNGLGTDGTQGLRAITKVDGIRIIQSPIESTFSSMPSNALLGDHVQHSVLLDQLGHLLISLTGESEFTEEVKIDKPVKTPRRLLSSGELRIESLDRSIVGILDMMREQLLMDIVLVTKKSGDDVVIIHSTDCVDDDSLEGVSIPKNQSLCQQVLNGHLPAVMPDVETMRLTHEVPATLAHVGAYMAAPVWLHNGDIYGTLCCLRSDSAPELDELQYRRLQMSARQIARLVNEAGMT
jgi:two-component system chemotaxis response regulator CheB